MKKLDFTVPFSGFADLDFINVLASVLLFLKGTAAEKTDAYACAKQTTGVCTGCGNCRGTLGALQEKTYFLLDTMCGRSSLRCRYDGTPTEMQKWIGETDADDCGTEETVEFLFGYVGFAYTTVIDRAAFAAAVKSSVDAGKPVIAKVPGNNGRFRVIIGYDGEELLEPEYEGAQHKPTEHVTMADLQMLYMIGAEIPRRYTERDGLLRIEKVMESNAAAGLWDEYAQNIGWWFGGMEGTTTEEQYARMKRIADTMWHTFNSHNFAEVFRYRVTKELQTPAFDALQQNMWAYGYTHDLAWSLIGLNDIIKWGEQWSGMCIGYAEMIQLVIYKIKENDEVVLKLVKEALTRL